MHMARTLPILALVVALQGCTVPFIYAGPIRAEIPTTRGKVQLVQTFGSGTFAFVSPGTTMNLVLPGYSDAHVVGSWRNGSDTVIVVEGPTFNCPDRYTVAALGPSNATVTQLGTCGAQFALGQRPDGSIAAQQIGVADPLEWTYANRQLAGPVLRSAVVGHSNGSSPQFITQPPLSTPTAEQPGSFSNRHFAPSFPPLQTIGPNAVPQPLPDPGLPQKTPPLSVSIDPE